MNLQERIDLLVKLGGYLQSDDATWLEIKERAERENGWFTHSFIDIATKNSAAQFLAESRLKAFAEQYQLSVAQSHEPKNIGLVMAGNIPLVGFHDWLCIFLSGHN